MSVLLRLRFFRSSRFFFGHFLSRRLLLFGELDHNPFNFQTSDNTVRLLFIWLTAKNYPAIAQPDACIG
jgi:hypothetical protein